MDAGNRPPTDADTAAELARVRAEPLLPAEKWLIGVSLALGGVLLVALWWVTTAYLPPGR